MKPGRRELQAKASQASLLELLAKYTCDLLKRMHRKQSEVMRMAMVTIRNIPDEVHRALRVRAASMEAEVREILESSVTPESRVKLGLLLADIGRRAKLTGEEFNVSEEVRDKPPAEPVSFE